MIVVVVVVVVVVGGGGGVNSSDGGPEPTYGDGDGARIFSLGLCFMFCKNVFSRVNLSIFL